MQWPSLPVSVAWLALLGSARLPEKALGKRLVRIRPGLREAQDGSHGGLDFVLDFYPVQLCQKPSEVPSNQGFRVDSATMSHSVEDSF